MLDSAATTSSPHKGSLRPRARVATSAAQKRGAAHSIHSLIGLGLLAAQGLPAWGTPSPLDSYQPQCVGTRSRAACWCRLGTCRSSTARVAACFSRRCTAAVCRARDSEPARTRSKRDGTNSDVTMPRRRYRRNTRRASSPAARPSLRPGPTTASASAARPTLRAGPSLRFGDQHRNDQLHPLCGPGSSLRRGPPYAAATC